MRFIILFLRKKVEFRMDEVFGTKLKEMRSDCKPFVDLLYVGISQNEFVMGGAWCETPTVISSRSY